MSIVTISERFPLVNLDQLCLAAKISDNMFQISTSSGERVVFNAVEFDELQKAVSRKRREEARDAGRND